MYLRKSYVDLGSPTLGGVSDYEKLLDELANSTMLTSVGITPTELATLPPAEGRASIRAKAGTKATTTKVESVSVTPTDLGEVVS